MLKEIFLQDSFFSNFFLSLGTFHRENIEFPNRPRLGQDLNFKFLKYSAKARVLFSPAPPIVLFTSHSLALSLSLLSPSFPWLFLTIDCVRVACASQWCNFRDYSVITGNYSSPHCHVTRDRRFQFEPAFFLPRTLR